MDSEKSPWVNYVYSLELYVHLEHQKIEIWI